MSAGENTKTSGRPRPGAKYAESEEQARATLSPFMFSLFNELASAAGKGARALKVTDVRLYNPNARRFANKGEFVEAYQKFVAEKATTSVADFLYANCGEATLAQSKAVVRGFLVSGEFFPIETKQLSKLSGVFDRATVFKTTQEAQAAGTTWKTSSGTEFSAVAFDPRLPIENALRSWHRREPDASAQTTTPASPAHAVASARAVTPPGGRGLGGDAVFDAERACALAHAHLQRYFSATANAGASDVADEGDAIDVAGIASRTQTPAAFAVLEGIFGSSVGELPAKDRDRLAPFPPQFALDVAALDGQLAVPDKETATGAWETTEVVHAMAIACNFPGWLSARYFEFLGTRGLLASEEHTATDMKSFASDANAQLHVKCAVAQFLAAKDFLHWLLDGPQRPLARHCSVLLAVASLAQSIARVTTTAMPLFSRHQVRCALTGRAIRPGEEVTILTVLLRPLDANAVIRAAHLEEVVCVISRRVPWTDCPLVEMNGGDEGALDSTEPRKPGSEETKAATAAEDEHHSSVDVSPMDIAPADKTPRARKERTPEQIARARERDNERRKRKREEEKAAKAAVAVESGEVAPATNEEKKEKKPTKKKKKSPAKQPRHDAKKLAKPASRLTSGFVGRHAALAGEKSKVAYVVDGGRLFQQLLQTLTVAVANPALLRPASAAGLSVADSARSFARAFAKLLEQPFDKVLGSLRGSQDTKASFLTCLQLLAGLLVKASDADALLDALRAADPDPPAGLLGTAAGSAGSALSTDLLDDILAEAGIELDPPAPAPLTLAQVYEVSPAPLASAFVHAAPQLIGLAEKIMDKPDTNSVVATVKARPACSLIDAVRAATKSDDEASETLARFLGVFAVLVPSVAADFADFTF